MPRHLTLRLGAVALAVLALPAIAPAQKFPGNLPAPGYAPAPMPEAGQPGPYDGSKAPAAARPRPAPAAATPVQADLDADALRLQAEDPPAIVGRVARVSGTTSLRMPGSEDWAPATLNTAIIPGNALWTQPGARAALEAGPAQLFLDGGTALQVDALDEGGLRASMAQGSLFLRLAGLETLGGAVDIATPEASIASAIDSRILIEAAAPDGSRPGRVAVFEGGAEVTLASSAEPIRLGPGQAISLAPGGGTPQTQPGGGTPQVEPGGGAPRIEPAGPPTPLMAWALGAAPRAPLPQAVRGMTGAAELSLAGRWDRSAEFGEVWYPPVAQDWVPYQDGSWEWRDPWGWTWVDAAPWGFVTGHYGRWARVGPRWGWLPAPVRVAGLPPLRPVWAPALVSFFAPPPRPGFGRPVGWIPLGPREAWYPWYRSSPAYVARVNYRQVPHLAPVRQRWTDWGGPDRRWADGRGPDGRWGDGRRDGGRWDAGRPEDRRFDAYRNRAAATWVPAETMLGSRPVRPEARRADAGLLRQAALAEGPPLRPEAETRGLTARDAERLGLAAGALRAARPERGAGPPPAVRAALPGPPAGPPSGRPEQAGPRGGPGPDLRQRLLDDQARRQQARPGPGPDDAARQRVDRQQELRRRQLDQQPGRRGPEGDDGRADKFDRPRQDATRPPAEQDRRQQQDRAREQVDQGRRQPQDGQREQADQARRQQEQMQRQQMEQGRRQPQDGQREQADQARRQQEQMQRQQMEQGRRQQQDGQREQADQARRQQEQMQRQQAEQGRRQQQEMQRQQADQARRQQEQMQRQQMEQGRRQQQEMQRQQADQARRQQEQMQRQQAEQGRRQQQEMQRQQAEQGRRQQEQQQRQQAAQAQRQQEQQQRQQQRRENR